jgi:hypothetical protein
VRQGFSAESFPCVRSLGVYMLLSYPRDRRFQGQVKLVPDGEDKVLRYEKFVAVFEDRTYLVPLAVEMENCQFPESGGYTVQVSFWVDAGDVLKAEHPFRVSQTEE